MNRWDFVGRLMRPAVKAAGLAPDFRTAIDMRKDMPLDKMASLRDDFEKRFNLLEGVKAEIAETVEAKVRADFEERATAIEHLARNCAGVMRDNGQETLAKMIEAQALIFTRPGEKP